MSLVSKTLIGLSAILCLSIHASSESDTHNGYWFDRADMPSARQEILPGELDAKIYVIGGWLDSFSITDLVEVYDPGTDSWTTVSPLPRSRHHCALASVDGILYVIGGYTNIPWPWEAIDTVLAYDPVTNEWTTRAPMIVGRGEHSAVVYDGKIYVTGGNDLYGAATSIVEVYDPVADSWAQVSSMPTARHHHASAVVDSLIYVVGGRQGYWGTEYTSISMVEAYSPASDTWYSIGDMPKPRGGLSAAGFDGKLYVFGGEIPGLFDEVEEYDPVGDNWRELTAMRTPRHGTAAVVIEDTVFVIGGGRSSGILTDNSNEGFVLGTCVDSDFDGFGDTDDPGNTCPPDNCPEEYNPQQNDPDGDLIGSLCDDCPMDPDNDIDEDSLCANVDNCPDEYNPEQIDFDGDELGDACDYICGDANFDATINVGDAVHMINYVFKNGPEPYPPKAGDANCDEALNVGDAVYLINHVFKSGPPPCCP